MSIFYILFTQYHLIFILPLIGIILCIVAFAVVEIRHNKLLRSRFLTSGIVLSISSILLVTLFSGVFIRSNEGGILKEISSLQCSSGNGRIIKYQYNATEEKTSDVFVYENSNNLVFLVDFYGQGNPASSFVDFVSQNNFVKNSVDNSSIMWDFPVYDFMRESMDYEVINNDNFEKKSNRIKQMVQNKKEGVDSSKKMFEYDSQFTLEATRINPDKISRSEFENIVSCTKENRDSVKVDVLVYARPKVNGYFTEMVCPNNSLIRVNTSGIVESKLARQSTRGFYNVEREILSIGYYDLDGDFIREKGLDDIYYPYSDFEFQYSQDSMTKNLKDTGFDQAYKESQTLKFLFNENQELVDDYLKTCKNQDGKTIFDIFKED